MVILSQETDNTFDTRRKIMMEQKANIKFRKFLASKSILTLNHASYSSDLTPCDYLPKTKNKAIGKAVWHFDHLKRLLAELKLITTFLKLYDCCKYCISSDFIIIYNYYLIEWILMKVWKFLRYTPCIYFSCFITHYVYILIID